MSEGRSPWSERQEGRHPADGPLTAVRGLFIFLSFILSTGGEHINPYYRPNHKKKEMGTLKTLEMSSEAMPSRTLLLIKRYAPRRAEPKRRPSSPSHRGRCQRPEKHIPEER